MPSAAWLAWVAKEDGLDELCQHVIEGGHMAEFCRARGLNYTSLLQWVNAQPHRAEMYARAREERSDKLADEIVAISDEVDVAAHYEGDEVRLKLDAAAVARNRLRVDARKWIAAKLKPRVYGDKLDVTAEVGIKALPDARLDEEIAKMSAQLGIASSTLTTAESEKPDDL